MKFMISRGQRLEQGKVLLFCRLISVVTRQLLQQNMSYWGQNSSKDIIPPTATSPTWLFSLHPDIPAIKSSVSQVWAVSLQPGQSCWHFPATLPVNKGKMSSHLTEESQQTCLSYEKSWLMHSLLTYWMCSHTILCPLPQSMSSIVN